MRQLLRTKLLQKRTLRWSSWNFLDSASAARDTRSTATKQATTAMAITLAVVRFEFSDCGADSAFRLAIAV